MAASSEGLRDARLRLAAAQKESWSAVANLLAKVRQAFANAAPAPEFSSLPSIDEAIRLFEETGRALLIDALEDFERSKPSRRSLEVIEDFDRDGGPSAVRISLRRARLDGAMQALLGRALLSLKTPMLVWLGGKDAPRQKERLARWLARLNRLDSAGAAVLARYERWAAQQTDAGRLPSAAMQKRHEAHLAFWWRRQRAVAGLLGLIKADWQAGGRLLRLAGAMNGRIELERADLLRALQVQIDYLEDWGGGHFDPPAIEARIATREERSEEWWSRCDSILEELLPQAMEYFLPFWILPSWLDRSWRLLPRRVFRDALVEAARGVFQKLFAAEMEDHLAIAHEIERAGEVIRYAAEASRASEGDLVPEAVRNVLDRLRERASLASEKTPRLAVAIAPVIFKAAREAIASAGKRPVLTFAVKARRRGARALREGGAGAAGQAESAAMRVVESALHAYDDLLVRIGWRTPVRIPSPPIVRRPELAESLKIRAERRELPALYLRLFRLAPVDDPRFLVGREEELDGFRQALNAWKEGRYAACQVIGARGSGKTSLLNCAMPEVFSGETVVRGQFHERLHSAQDFDSFLLRLLSAGGAQSLEPLLESSRRVIVLEEAERVFLKCFGGFAAASRLLEIIQSSAPTTLWIIVLNIHGCRLLAEAVHWNGFFSHTINSMSVWRDDLVRAILQRHNLSGLKLAFAAPAIGGLRRRLGFEPDPQEAFFDSLYEQSGGNFRSAFELWQSSIERVEGGTIHMRQPLAPDLAPLRKALIQEDHFALLSILQHGSLTPEELGIVLLRPQRAARIQLERLQSLGVLEPDPEHPGLRVAPEAQRFVHNLLLSVNLI